jgi:F-type H+-transporting ATPase subunit delta
VALRGAAARRYAQAVFDIAKDAGTIDRWLADLKTLGGAFGSPEVVRALEDPKLKESEQRTIVNERLAASKIDPLALNLIYLLVRRNRLALLPRIVQTYQQLYNSEKGIVVADVTSAVQLSEAQQRQVISQLSQVTGKTIQLRVHHDPRILGGLVTRIGDELIDTSVATRFATLAERLT